MRILNKELERGGKPKIISMIDLDALPKTAEMTPKEAGQALALSTTTLALFRHRDAGPAFSKIGRSVFYRVDDLIAFREARRKRFEPSNLVAMQVRERHRHEHRKAQAEMAEIFGD